MLNYKIFIGLTALFGVYQYYQTTDKFAKAILCGQVVAIILGFVPIDYIPLVGHLLFMLTLALAVVYGIKKKDFTLKKRLVIIIPAVFLLVRQVFQIQHYPGVGLLSLVMVIPILGYLVAMVTDFKSYKNEFGFLTIIIADMTFMLMMYLF